MSAVTAMMVGAPGRASSFAAFERGLAGLVPATFFAATVKV